MTSPMDLPLYGKVRLFETSKSGASPIMAISLKENDITITENSKVESIVPEGDIFNIATIRGDRFTSSRILLAMAAPRKLNVPGEMSEKVAYRLLEPEVISGKQVVVAGGGRDSAVESALLLADRNKVVLSYRNDVFSRIKPLNNMALNKAVDAGKIEVMLKTNIISIDDETVALEDGRDGRKITLQNDLVYILQAVSCPLNSWRKPGSELQKNLEKLLEQFSIF